MHARGPLFYALMGTLLYFCFQTQDHATQQKNDRPFAAHQHFMYFGSSAQTCGHRSHLSRITMARAVRGLLLFGGLYLWLRRSHSAGSAVFDHFLTGLSHVNR